jgi:hypothetical protein
MVSFAPSVKSMGGASLLGEWRRAPDAPYRIADARRGGETRAVNTKFTVKIKG